MSTQGYINSLQPENFYRVPIQFFSNIFKSIISFQQHTHSLLQLVIISFLSVIFLVIFRKIFIIRNNLKEKLVVLEITLLASSEKSAYATQQLFSIIHDTRSGNGFVNWVLGRKLLFSFEIASTLNSGIKYYVRVSPDQAENIKRTIRSYLPSIGVKEVNDYLGNSLENTSLYSRIIEFKLGKRFGYPLQKQDLLSEHDPIAYITGQMTQLEPEELISYQVVVSPTESKEVPRMMKIIYSQGDLFAYLDRPQYPYGLNTVFSVVTLLVKLLHKLGEELQWAITEVFHGSSTTAMNRQIYALYEQNMKLARIKPMRQLSPFERETIQQVREKIEQPLFKSSIRILVSVKSKRKLQEKIQGLQAAFKPFAVPQYQSLQTKTNFPPGLIQKIRNHVFQKRLLSLVNNTTESLLSVSEVADLYHIPAKLTQTENIVKSHSKELPTPLSLKQSANLDIVFAQNTYAESITPIGLTKEERARHIYMIGATGTGKSTMLLSMINQDVKNGKGVCVIDPHGDLAQSVINCIPQKRINDFIYFNPYDIKYPIGINLLELTPGLEEDDSLIEKEFIAESVISLFRKVFSDSFSSHPHRIEYILRNTIHTAFSVENPTLFTIFDLLNNPKYQKEVVRQLQDEDLKNFWKYEFGKAGDYQKVKMVAPVTSRIGRFLFSPSARRILEQEKSTINFDEILDQEKILICNLAKGNIGEDTSEVMGIMILNKIQLAVLKRARMEQAMRKNFYLYVDEFQNFATPSFVQMLSESRKYGLNLTMAEQSTSQQQDRNTTNIILANVGSVISFRSANPMDEELLIRQFSPYITSGELLNLPSFHFYMKKAAILPEEPFSGVTTPVKIQTNKEVRARLIEASRKNWAIEYKSNPKHLKRIKVTEKTEENTIQKPSQSAYPEG